MVAIFTKNFENLKCNEQIYLTADNHLYTDTRYNDTTTKFVMMTILLSRNLRLTDNN